MSISNQKHLDPESIMKTNIDPAVNLKVAPDYDKEMAKTRREKLQKIDRTPREYTLWSTSFRKFLISEHDGVDGKTFHQFIA